MCRHMFAHTLKYLHVHTFASIRAHAHTQSHTTQSLVDDNLVHQEKIGISNYFW